MKPKRKKKPAVRHDLKKLFGSSFKEPTAKDYATSGMLSVDQVLAGLETNGPTPTKKPQPHR